MAYPPPFACKTDDYSEIMRDYETFTKGYRTSKRELCKPSKGILCTMYIYHVVVRGLFIIKPIVDEILQQPSNECCH